MPDVIINFKAQVTGNEDVVNALVEQGKLEQSTADSVKKTNAAFSEQAKITQQDASAIAKLNEQLKNIPKALAGVNAREMKQLGDQIKAGTLSVNAFETSIALARKQLAGLPKDSEAFAKLQDELKANIVVNENLNKSFKSTRAELRAMREAIFQLEDAGLDGTKAFENLSIEAGKLDDAAGDVQARIKTLASDTFKFDVALQATTALTAGFSIAQGAAALLGNESEELQKTLLKVNAAIAILNGLQQIQALTQKETALSIGLTVALQKISTLQTNLQSAAESRFIVVRYAAIAAQTVLNAVMAANPAGIIIFAIAALATAVLALTRDTEDASEAQKKYNLQLEVSLGLTREYTSAVAAAGEVIVAQLEAEGAAQADIRKARIDNLREQLRIQEEGANRASANFAKANEQYRQKVKEEKSISVEEREARQEAYDLANDAQAAANDTRRRLEIAELNNTRDTNKELKEEAKKATEDAKKANEDAKKARQDALRDKVAEAQADVLNARDTRVKLVAEMILANAQMRLALAEDNIGPGARLLAEVQQGEAIRKARAEFFGDLQEIETDFSKYGFQKRLEDNQKRLQADQQAAQTSIRITEDEVNAKIAAQQRLVAFQIQAAQVLASSIVEISRNQSERELAVLQDRLDRGIITQEQYEQKTRAIKRRAAQQEKQLALFQATIAQSLAVLAVIKDQTIPVALKPVFIALAVAQALAQIAAIASRPIPAFKKGTKNAPGGPSLIGEAGGELYHSAGKWGYAASAQIVNLSPGAKVIPAPDTARILSNYNIPQPAALSQYHVDSYGGIKIDYKKLGRVIGREVGKLPLTQWSYDERGVTKRQTNVSNRIAHTNKRYSSK
jgi:hypothetical protein